MKKFLFVIMVMLFWLVAISHAQPSAEWARIKELALSGKDTSNPGQRVRYWIDRDKLWSCCYNYETPDSVAGISWSEAWNEEGVRKRLIVTYYESGKLTGKFKTMMWAGDSYTAAMMDYNSGVESAAGFLKDLRPLIQRDIELAKIKQWADEPLPFSDKDLSNMLFQLFKMLPRR